MLNASVYCIQWYVLSCRIFSLYFKLCEVCQFLSLDMPTHYIYFRLGSCMSVYLSIFTWYVLPILPTAPSASPQNVSLLFYTSDSIVVTWMPPPTLYQNGVIRRYDVRITHLNTSIVQTLASRGLSTVIPGLTPNSQYQIEVAAYTVSLGPFSSSLTVSTKEDG